MISSGTTDSMAMLLTHGNSITNTLPRVYKTCTDRFSEFSKIRGLRAGILKPYDRHATAIPAPPYLWEGFPTGVRPFGDMGLPESSMCEKPPNCSVQPRHTL
jgi:hypothetical protein